MFNQGVTTTSVRTGFDDSIESKYTVAEILSSMTSTTPVTPTTLTSGAFCTGAATGTTPTLTPTTLNNIEQTFLNLQHNSTVTRAQDLSRESGFVPPIIDSSSTTPVMVQIKSEQLDYDDSSMGSDPDYGMIGPGGKRRRNEDGSFSVPNIDPNTYLVANSRRPTGPRKDKRSEHLTVEEEERRSVRRERNKQAAAKCRQRREDHTSRLINETEGLEEEKVQLESEIQTLHQQKEQLEFILQAHKASCQAVKRQLKATTITTDTPKSIPYNIQIPNTNMPATSNLQQQTLKYSAASSSSKSFCSTRPNTLPIANTIAHRNVHVMPSVTEAIGVSISTPSTGVGVFNFESMAEGHTGLTPYSGIAPSTIGGPSHTLPPPNTSCSGQVKRRSTDSSSSNELSSPTLISL